MRRESVALRIELSQERGRRRGEDVGETMQTMPSNDKRHTQWSSLDREESSEGIDDK
jgi:hypothetical protein